MADEPRNAASDVSRRNEPLLNDRDFMLRDGLSLLTEDFVRYDCRKVTTHPPVDRQGFIDAWLIREELTGEWPVFKFIGVVAVRGDRLAATRWKVVAGDMAEFDSITVTRVDEALDRTELAYFFDGEDLDKAIAELDRLHAELGGE